LNCTTSVESLIKVFGYTLGTEIDIKIEAVNSAGTGPGTSISFTLGTKPG